MRIVRQTALLAGAVTALATCMSVFDVSLSSSVNSSDNNVERNEYSSLAASQANIVRQVVLDGMADGQLKAVIVRVTVDGKEILTEAFGESMSSVKATTDMHFRNGAVAISYVSTLLLQLVDEKKVSLNDKVAKWLPHLPHSDRVTLGQLAQMTSGYADYVQNPAFVTAFYAQPFRTWTPEELISFGTSQPLLYTPGTNWNYSHTNYVLLGLALEKITGKPVKTLMQERVLGPLGLTNTTDPESPFIPEPALHAFSSERRSFLKIPANTPFYEESTYWNPSWTLTRGAIQTTNIYDLHDTAIAIGTGKLLSPESYQAMVSTSLRGRTTTLPGCNTCFPQSLGYTYGLGIVITGNWLIQNPLFGGYSAVAAYLPSKKIAIAIAVTYDQSAFDKNGDYKNVAEILFRRIGGKLAPNDPPPVRK